MINHNDANVPPLTGTLKVTFFPGISQPEKDRLFLESAVRVRGYDTSFVQYQVEPMQPVESLNLVEFGQIAMRLLASPLVRKVEKQVRR